MPLFNRPQEGQTAAPRPRRTNLTHEHVSSEIRVKSTVFGWPDALHWHGSVIPNVALPVFIFTLWSFLVWLFAYLVYPSVDKVAIPPTFITVISLVLSLLLVFRTNTAYDRYNEGRKLWSTLIVNARNLARLIWISVDERTVRDSREKLAAMNLIIAFAVATRNHLRAEYGLKDEDGEWRHELVSLIPRKKRDDLASRPMHPHLQLEHTATGFSSGSAPLRQRARAASVSSHTAVPMDEDVNVSTDRSCIPVDLTHLLSAYIVTQRKKEKIDVPQFGVMTTLVSSMVDTISQLERVLTSPIPLAYSVHIKQALYIYLLILPFQIIQPFKALSILVVFLAAFTMLGVESIGAEIENPFGVDLNDINLNGLVDSVRNEIDAIKDSMPIDLAEWDLNVRAATYGSAIDPTPASSSATASSLQRPANSRKAEFQRSGLKAYDRLMASSDNIHGGHGHGHAHSSSSAGSSPRGTPKNSLSRLMGNGNN
ncbi:hypothetical protein H9P43_000904 [Blastocladiella emersonii ATCC 22665]|nr:hypothetical protein H9P43_000904 [Blastocladiella emersonii ATCC 22665]